MKLSLYIMHHNLTKLLNKITPKKPSSSKHRSYNSTEKAKKNMLIINQDKVHD